MTQADQLLVRRLLAGERRAFDEFFDGQVERLYRFALRRLDNDPGMAEDVVQAVLAKAIEKLATFRGEASLLTWLCTICRREIADQGRVRLRRGREGPFDENRMPAEIGASDGPEETLCREERARLIRTTLDSLPSHYGEVLEWKYIEEIPVKEIAERLGMSVKAAESTLTRARRGFRAALTAAEGEGQRSEEVLMKERPRGGS